MISITTLRLGKQSCECFVLSPFCPSLCLFLAATPILLRYDLLHRILSFLLSLFLILHCLINTKYNHNLSFFIYYYYYIYLLFYTYYIYIIISYSYSIVSSFILLLLHCVLPLKKKRKTPHCCALYYYLFYLQQANDNTLAIVLYILSLSLSLCCITL